MKRNLKRIEVTLHQLDTPTPSPTLVRSQQSAPSVSSAMPSSSAVPTQHSVSFEVKPKPTLPQPPVDSPSKALAKVETGAMTPDILSDFKTPTLPKFKSLGLTSHRNAANPAIAMNLLKEMEGIVAGWQEELHQVLRCIQDVYLEGPIVDGWLESYTQEEGTANPFRHADVNCLMDYVEKQWGAESMNASSTTVPDTEAPTHLEADLNGAGYRLCGLNEDGQLWFRHCPSEQVPAVSLAIARYQKLRQFLIRKQHLETQLSQLAETLVMLHSQFANSL